MIGIAPSEFWRMLPAETWVIINNYYKQEELEFQAEWERVRWLGTYIFNSGWVKKKKSPKEILPFPWDSEGEVSPQDVETLRKEMGWQLPEQH